MKLDVIEKVEGPTSWVNPLVVVEKPNGDIRICLDMRQANLAIVREKHPAPTVEETLQEVSNAKVFSKLDLNMAFHQIELHPDSRDITAFAAPNGPYRYKRLLFGVNMATEKFQQIVWQIIKDCTGAYNLHDDPRVIGANDKEHDETAYFKQGAETRLTTDASLVGVGAILEQRQEDGSYRPIYYASRKLSKVETRYSQFEREALAVRWACEKFYLYLYGINFEICTD